MRIEDIELTYFEIIPETYTYPTYFEIIPETYTYPTYFEIIPETYTYPTVRWKLKEIKTTNMINYEFIFKEVKDVESQLV